MNAAMTFIVDLLKKVFAKYVMDHSKPAINAVLKWLKNIFMPSNATA